MRLIKKTNINFMGKNKIMALLSICLVISGIISLIIKDGPNLSIDFTGGTIAQLKFEKEIDITKLREK